MAFVGNIDLSAITKLIENLGAGGTSAQGGGQTSQPFSPQTDSLGAGANSSNPQAAILREIELLLKLLLELEQSQNGATPSGLQQPSNGSASPAGSGSTGSGPSSTAAHGNPAAASATNATGPGATNAPAPSGAAPATGSINDRIAGAAQQLLDASSADGPGGGYVACAYEVNKALSLAGVASLGDNPNYVPSVEAALRGGRGVQVSAAEAQPGDIAIAGGDQHVGIVTGAGASGILSNDSYKDSFSWQSSGASFDQYFGSPTRYYRVVN